MTKLGLKNESTENLLLGEFNFDPKEILNKKVIFDTTITDEEIITDRLIDAINDLLMISIG